eukprot:maker-scaffold_27-snap-gene-1.17-mRNA-1 protein AED:0.00 eAED:0.00 QI:85/1/1/1/1/1/2/166/227
MSNGITLGQPYEGVKPFRFVRLKGYDLFLCSGTVVNFTGDALVNSTNEAGVGRGGIDSAITDLGGEQLLKARESLPIVAQPGIRIPTGQARLTIGGGLGTNYCIHTVGPMFYESYNETPEELLQKSYKSVLRVLEGKEEISTLAICLISAGMFRGIKPLKEVIALGLEAIKEFDEVQGEREEKKKLFVCGFTTKEMKELDDAGILVFPPPVNSDDEDSEDESEDDDY